MKRFTETNKWIDPWFRRLSHQSKLLWFYLVDHCDNIGLVEIDYALVSADCGTKITQEHLVELKDRIQCLDDGKVFLPKFIPFQYGTLSENCVPHRKVIEAIRFHSLTQTFKGYAYPSARVGATLSHRVDSRAINKEEEEDKEKEGKNRARGTFDDVTEFCRGLGLFPRDVEYLWNRWESNGWKNAGKSVKDWRAVVRAWKAQGYLPSQKTQLPSDIWPVESVDSMGQDERLAHYRKAYRECDWPFILPNGEFDFAAKAAAKKAEVEAAKDADEGSPPEPNEGGDGELW